VYDTVAESVFVEKLEAGARVGRQRGVAPAEDDWPDEQLELVDQPGHESLGCEVRATHEEIQEGATRTFGEIGGFSASRWRATPGPGYGRAHLRR
jgi:hypothetical protein